MSDAEILWIARAVHVAAVVLWIGGVAFVTTVVLPAIGADFEPGGRLAEFERYERRFGRQARWTTQLVGASGLVMAWKLDAWFRFTEPGYWWMHAMVGVWALFTVLLFVVEPLFFHRLLRRLAARDPRLPHTVLVIMHRVLLGLGLVTVMGASAGAHGWFAG